MNNFMGIWVLKQECIVPVYLSTLQNYVIKIRNTDFYSRALILGGNQKHLRTVYVQGSSCEKLARNCEMSFVLHMQHVS